MRPSSSLMFVLSFLAVFFGLQPGAGVAASGEIAPQYFSGEPQPQHASGTGLLPARHALVIGIDRYQLAEADANPTVSPIRLANLQQPSKDAATMSAALRKAGFEVASLVSTGDAPYVRRNDILNALSDLSNRAAASFRKTGRRSIVTVYFAGHGLSALSPDGSGNFLLPSDFRPRKSDDIAAMALSVEDIHRRLGSKSTTLRILILDACRNDLSYSIPAANGGDDVAVQIRHVQQPLPNASDHREDINNSYVLYSTLNGDKASDDGAFSREFAKAIDAVQADVLQAGSGEKSSLPSLKDGILPPLSAAGQKIEASDGTMAFRLFWTKKDFESERQSWELARDIKGTTAGTTAELRKEVFCRFVQHLKTFTYYSYFYPEVKRELSWDEAPADGANCVSARKILQSAIDSRHETAVSSGGDLHADKVSRLTPLSTTVSKTLIKDVVSENVLAGLKGLDAGQPVDQLAIAVSDTGLFSKNDLVQIERALPGNKFEVRTDKGRTGIANGAEINVGRTALDFTVAYVADALEPSADAIPRQLISESVVTDLSISYREEDGPIAFTRAQTLAALLLRSVNNGTENKRSSIVPSVRPASTPYATKSQNDNLQPGSLHVVMSVLPLKDATRASLPQFDTATIPASQSVDVAFAYPADSAQGAGPRSARSRGPLSQPSPDQTPIERCLLSGAANEGGGKDATVYVQIASNEQKSAYTIIAGGLRRAGFTVPAFEIIKPSSMPSANQVRFCENVTNRAAAVTALKILNSCGQGTFGGEPVRIAPTLCQRAVNKSIEIWLRKPQDN